VAIIPFARNEAVECNLHIPRDIRIIAFIDENGSGGVRHVKMAYAVLASGVVHELFDFAGDID
jgi:hypothetical protein